MIPQGVVSECHSSVMVLATRMSQMVLPSSVWPAADSNLLWEFQSLQMLLVIQAGPTSNMRTLWPSSIMCGEASTCRSSFGVTLALRKEAEGQDSQWPCCSSLQLCSSPGQESQGSPAVTHHSSTVLLPHSQPPLTPCCSGPFPIRCLRALTISKLLISSFQSSQIPGLCSQGSINSPKWEPGVLEQQPCVFASAHPHIRIFLKLSRTALPDTMGILSQGTVTGDLLSSLLSSPLGCC